MPPPRVSWVLGFGSSIGNMNTTPVTVSVLSPLPAVARGLAGMLAGGQVEVLDLATTPYAAVGHADPDVVLYDTQALADGDGADLEHLVATTSAVVLAMTHDLRPQLAERALAHGAHGVFSSTTGRDALAATVVEAASLGASGPLVPVVTRLGADVGLTPREVDVLSLITRGLSNQEIAERSYLSINSVKTYIRGAYRRIGVTSRSQAVVWCVQHGFVGATV
jgi:DNA-binding NarL/FixJ family response regulator